MVRTVIPIWYLEAKEGVDLDQWAARRGHQFLRDLQCRGFVVAAPNQRQARRLAFNAEQEGLPGPVCERWLDATLTSCIRVVGDRVGVIVAFWPN